MQTTAQTTPPAMADSRIKTQRLGFGDVLAEGWRHYSGNFWRIVIILLCVEVPVFIIQSLVSVTDFSSMESYSPTRSLAASAVSLLTGLVAVIAVLAIAKVVEESVLGRKISAGSALWHGLTRWPASIGSFLLMWLLTLLVIIPIALLFVFAAVALGLVFSGLESAGAELLAILVGVLGVFLFVLVVMVPLIAIGVYLGFYPYANSLRRQGPLGALRYSKNTVSGMALHVFGYELGIGILTGIVTMCTLGFAFMGGVLMSLIPDLTIPIKATIIVVQLIGSIVGALFTSMLIVLFLNLDYLKHPAVAAAPEAPAAGAAQPGVSETTPVAVTTPVVPAADAAVVDAIAQPPATDAAAIAQPPATDAAAVDAPDQPSSAEPPTPNAAS